MILAVRHDLPFRPFRSGKPLSLWKALLAPLDRQTRRVLETLRVFSLKTAVLGIIRRSSEPAFPAN
jgi:hypothetical protein